jgi:tripartite-type tricarboxylate transporter receptor subunit TctC
MFKPMIKQTMAALAVSGLALAGSMGAAQAEYPEKPITMVIPLGAGGSHDLNARVITSIIPEYLGQAMIVRLTPGAGGQKGTQEVSRAAADGYTLLFTHNYIDMLQQYVETLPYDPLKDFVPVVRVNYAPASIVVRADSPYQTFEELVADAKARPGELNLGHSGNWGAFFVPAAQIMKKLDFTMNMVPYQGGGPAMQALLSGDSDMTMSFPSGNAALLAAGKIRVLATAGKERLYQDVPTFEEVGIDGDIGFMHRFVLAPAGTPPEVIAKLEAAFMALKDDTTFQRLMSTLDESIDLIGSAEYQTMREAQAVAYQDLVKSLTSQ